MGHFCPYIGLLLVHSLALSINLDDLHYVSLVPARRLLQDLASGCRLGVGSLKRARRGTWGRPAQTQDWLGCLGFVLFCLFWQRDKGQPPWRAPASLVAVLGDMLVSCVQMGFWPHVASFFHQVQPLGNSKGLQSAYLPRCAPVGCIGSLSLVCLLIFSAPLCPRQQP